MPRRMLGKIMYLKIAVRALVDESCRGECVANFLWLAWELRCQANVEEIADES